VLVDPGSAVRAIAQFADFADPQHPYMYHCHNLEHEDAGMMGQFLVV
jgi:bilirubin oxidase